MSAKAAQKRAILQNQEHQRGLSRLSATTLEKRRLRRPGSSVQRLLVPGVAEALSRCDSRAIAVVAERLACHNRSRWFPEPNSIEASWQPVFVADRRHFAGRRRACRSALPGNGVPDSNELVGICQERRQVLSDVDMNCVGEEFRQVMTVPVGVVVGVDDGHVKSLNMEMMAPKATIARQANRKNPTKSGATTTITALP